MEVAGDNGSDVGDGDSTSGIESSGFRCGGEGEVGGTGMGVGRGVRSGRRGGAGERREGEWQCDEFQQRGLGGGGGEGINTCTKIF